MSRWHLLKSAVGGKRDSNSESSIHKFKGFELHSRRKLVWPGFHVSLAVDDGWNGSMVIDYVYNYMSCIDTCECTVRLSGPEGVLQSLVVDLDQWSVVARDDTSVVLRARHATLQPTMKTCSFYEHNFDAHEIKALKLYTREKPQQGGLSARELLSNQLHNVDNTGNICASRVLELGGGLSAMAGLGLAAWFSARQESKSVVITDGHPDCVANQRVCIEMCRNKSSIAPDYPISSSLLHWAVDQNADSISALTSGGSEPFDLIIASDCLFFRDFHDDLVQTLLRLLTPEGSVLLLQPQRDGTLDRFVSKCSEHFSVQQDHDYCERVTALRLGYQSQADSVGYSEDVHYPIMLHLRKKWT